MQSGRRGRAPGSAKVPGSGRRKGTLNRATREVRDVARGLLESDAYLDKLRARLVAGELSPQVEVMLYRYAYGVPRREYALEVEAAGAWCDEVPDALLVRQIAKLTRTV